ncbi:MAG: class I SAM-dependent methyltransferase [Bacteroidales bacterium]|nr:class I SAM-dependent methyltransferase [Bacteroidales bacterium]
MHLSLFQIANIVLIGLLLFLFIRFLWMTFLHPPSQPAAWKEGVKMKQIPASLIRLERFYPDKVRFYTWWLQAERLKKEKISGAYAELGVYQGESARILHLMDPGRKFYLFDTFEGFPKEDLQGETGKAATYTTQDFAGTSIARVIRKINGNDRIEVVQGYFPDTADAVRDQSFALVNIDADLYKPTKAGLEFFYPRLTPGGVIFVHDYNSKWPGVIRAVDGFLATVPETLVLIPDREGTVVIVRDEGGGT